MKLHRLTLAALVTTLLFAASVAYADEKLGDLSYWYSDASDIGYWIPNNVKYIVGRDASCTMNAQNLLEYANYGMGVWDFGLQLQSVSNQANADIVFTCIDRATARSLGFPDSADAATVYLDRYRDGFFEVGGDRRSGYTLDTVWVMLIYDSRTSQYTANKWKAIAAHEMGHAFGWSGHSTQGGNNLMYYATNVYYDQYRRMTPTSSDKAHLQQVYDFWY